MTNDNTSTRAGKIRRFSVFAVIVAVISVGGWYSPIGQNLQCTFGLRNGLNFRMPATDGLTFAEYEVLIEERTMGCGRLAVRTGSTDPDAVVICCGEVGYSLTTAIRTVLVDTEPG